jgi:hypothetical protein
MNVFNQLKTKLNDNSAYRKALEKMPELNSPSSFYDPHDEPDMKSRDEKPMDEKPDATRAVKLEEVPPVKGPEPPELPNIIDDLPEPVESKKLTRRKKDNEPKTRGTVRVSTLDDTKQINEDRLKIPPFTAKEREELGRVEFKNISAKIKFIIDNTGWGKYCNEHFRRAAGNPSQERLNKIIQSDNKDDYQSISGIFAMARP